MKRIFLSAALSVSMSFSAFAQIPVTDLALIGTEIENHAVTIAKWVIQHEEMLTRINQAQKQFDALTGTRALGAIMDDPAFKDYLPLDWQGVYDSVRDGGYSGLSGAGKKIFEANKIYDSCQHLVISEQRISCEAQAAKSSQDKSVALDAFDAARNRIAQIDALMHTINTTKDPKGIAELQGRIATESAAIANEQTKLQMYAMVSAAEDKVQEQREAQLNAKDSARRGWIQPDPIIFGN